MRVTVAVLAGLLLASGCSPSSEAGGVSSMSGAAPVTSVSASASLSPTPLVPGPSASPSDFELEAVVAGESRDQAAVRVALVEYFYIYEKYVTNRTAAVDVDDMLTVMTSDPLSSALTAREQNEAKGLVGSGVYLLRQIEVDDPVDTEQGRTAAVRFCLDRTGRTATLPDGQPFEVPYTYLDHAVTFLESSSGRWRVLEVTNKVVERC